MPLIVGLARIVLRHHVTRVVGLLRPLWDVYLSALPRGGAMSASDFVSGGCCWRSVVSLGRFGPRGGAGGGGEAENKRGAGKEVKSVCDCYASLLSAVCSVSGSLLAPFS